MTEIGRRIAVVGTTGSGKTTMARQLSLRLDIPHVEMDAIYWQPNWTETPTDLFREMLAEALSAGSWVTDGNYGKVRDIVLGRAETLIWLDYPLSLILRRLTARTTRRVAGRLELWNGNRERLRDVFGRENILLWAVRTHRRRRTEYEALLRERPYPRLQIIRLRSPTEARRWLASLATGLADLLP
jgi:adenylate kinase family enzyme